MFASTLTFWDAVAITVFWVALFGVFVWILLGQQILSGLSGLLPKRKQLCPYCNEPMRATGNTDKSLWYVCGKCQHPYRYYFPEFDKLSPGDIIDLLRKQATAAKCEFEQVLEERDLSSSERSLQLIQTEKDRKDAVLLHQKERKDWVAHRDNYEKALVQYRSDIQGHNVTIQQREAHIRSLDTRIGQLENAIGERVATEKSLNLTIARLLQGDFTSDELQGLCHNLSENNYKAFVDGCANYQKKIFGKCHRDTFQEEISILLEEAKELRSMLNSWKSFAANLELNSNSLGVSTRKLLDPQKASVGRMVKAYIGEPGREVQLNVTVEQLNTDAKSEIKE